MFDFFSEKKKINLYHITHWKAGSQWIYKILKKCAPRRRIVKPRASMGQFLEDTIQPGKIYPTLYFTYKQFTSVPLPKGGKRFVVIRDLRDSLISYYFSMKLSHPITGEVITNRRAILNNCANEEEGLIYLLNNVMSAFAEIQHSWLEVEEPLIRYEDLLKHDVEILTPIIMECLPISEKKVGKIILANRFEAMTRGRKRGQEDVNSHERKANPGDWQNYFTKRVKQEFKSKFGDLLIKAGYEVNNNW